MGDYRVIYEIQDRQVQILVITIDYAVKFTADHSRHALRAGFTIEEIFNLTKIDRWFLVQSKEIADFVAARASGLNHAQEINVRRAGLVVGVHHAHVMGASGLEFEFQPRIPSASGVVIAGEQVALGIVEREQ